MERCWDPEGGTMIPPPDSMDSSFLANVKSSAITALIGAAGIGIQYASINEFTKAMIGVAIAATMVFRAVIAFLDMVKRFKQKGKTDEQANG